ncbi:MAG: hypothetical protein NSGCLCUN01_00919 [uncultured Clostridium sp.]
MVKNFETIKELYNNNCVNVPNKPGIYIVKLPDNFKVDILDTTTGINEYKGKSLLLEKDKLINKFDKISNNSVLYYGKAEDLKRRIKQYVKYGYAEDRGHRGGRAIWQIKGCHDLIIEYYLNSFPREYEKKLLQEFKEKNNSYPFANWKG